MAITLHGMILPVGADISGLQSGLGQAAKSVQGFSATFTEGFGTALMTGLQGLGQIINSFQFDDLGLTGVAAGFNVAGNAALAFGGPVGQALSTVANMAASASVALSTVASASFAVMTQANKMENNLGISADAFLRLSHAATINESDTETLSAALGIYARSLGNVRAGERSAIAEFERFGLVAEQFANLPLDQSFIQLIEHVGTLNNENDRAAILFTLLGRRGTDLMNLTHGDNLREGMEDAARLGYTITAQQSMIADNLDDNITRIRHFQTAVGFRMVTAIAPSIEGIAQRVTSLGPQFLPVFDGIGRGLGNTFAELTHWFDYLMNSASLFNQAMTQGVTWAKAIWDTIMSPSWDWQFPLLARADQSQGSLIKDILDGLGVMIGALLPVLSTILAISVRLLQGLGNIFHNVQQNAAGAMPAAGMAAQLWARDQLNDVQQLQAAPAVVFAGIAANLFGVRDFDTFWRELARGGNNNQPNQAAQIEQALRELTNNLRNGVELSAQRRNWDDANRRAADMEREVARDVANIFANDAERAVNGIMVNFPDLGQWGDEMREILLNVQRDLTNAQHAMRWMDNIRQTNDRSLNNRLRRVQEIAPLFENNQDDLERGLGLMFDEIANESGKPDDKLPAAFEMGSREALSAIARATRATRADPIERMQDILERQREIQARQLDNGRQILQALRAGQFGIVNIPGG